METTPEFEVSDQPTREDIEKCIATTKKTINGYSSIAPSFAKIIDNLYIGNVGAAAQSYFGTLTQFGGVFSALGWERYGTNPKLGYSSKTGYNNLGIDYATAFDERFGTTLVDRRFRTCAFVAEQRWPEESVARGDRPTKPSVAFVYNGKKYVIYPTDLTLDTEKTFVGMMHLAAHRIEQLMERKSGDVLVHCREGRNRSAACIAAYLIIKRGYTATDAISLIQEANKNERGIPFKRSLDNPSYRKTLRAIEKEKAMPDSHTVTLVQFDVECVQNTYREIRRLGMRYHRTWPEVQTEHVGCESESSNDQGRCCSCLLTDEPDMYSHRQVVDTSRSICPACCNFRRIL